MTAVLEHGPAYDQTGPAPYRTGLAPIGLARGQAFKLAYRASKHGHQTVGARRNCPILA